MVCLFTIDAIVFSDFHIAMYAYAALCVEINIYNMWAIDNILRGHVCDGHWWYGKRINNSP